MGDNRLNLGVLSIERDLSSALSLDSVLDHFQAVDRNRRIILKSLFYVIKFYDVKLLRVKILAQS